MEDWQETTRVVFPPPALHAPPSPCTALVYDTSQELFWTGNGFGRITSFYGPELQRYTSYRGHDPAEGSVKQILPCEKGILSINRSSIHLSSRRGPAIWNCTNSAFVDLRCMCLLDKTGLKALVAGCQGSMFKINVEAGEIIETVVAPENYTLLRRAGPYICAATASGSVHLLDPDSLQLLKSWKAHAGWISDMDANSNFLVTCGWSPRQHFGNMPDPLAKVYDLKNLQPLSPVPFHAGAAFVRMHPRMMTTGVIASQNGQIQLVDFMNASMVTVKQITLLEDNFLLGIDMAPSGEALAVADSMCTLQLWGFPSKIRFTDYSNPTEFPDSTPPDRQIMEWNSHEPFSSIGMPYYREVLLSSWPSHLVSDVGAPPARIDPLILAATRRGEMGSYGPNPRTTRRNQIQQTRPATKTRHYDGPKFLSEQAKDGESVPTPERRVSEISEALHRSRLNGEAQVEVPMIYRNVEIKYSRFGVDDFDFEYYNKTTFSGLETHISNSYANPLLQVLRFTIWTRNLALHHAATSCISETCLLCEMGFLFDMLEKARGQNCQATNFLKTFGSLPATASLGMIDEGAQRPLSFMIQAVNRYLSERVVVEFQQTALLGQGKLMDWALTTQALSNIRCAHCANETVKSGNKTVHELVYPDVLSPKAHHMRMQGPSFSQILKASVERQDHTRGWCDRCKRYQQLSASKTVQSIPFALMLNTAIQSGVARQLWSRPGWLPQEIGVIVQSGQFFCYEGKDLEYHVQNGKFPIQVYELVGIVADINGGDAQKSHLVSIINVSHSARNQMANNDWYLFNDFLVRQIPEEEALSFDPAWKLPSIVTYELKKYRHGVDDSWQDHLDPTILFRYPTSNIAHRSTEVLPLSLDTERPIPGTEVGIDAEFVSLRQEEIEIKPDGSRSIRLPARLGLARVSVLRGDYDKDIGSSPQLKGSESSGNGIRAVDEGLASMVNKDDAAREVTPAYTPFVDDYIATSDPIVDYLTQFSGISPGDLSLGTSPYAASGRLVSLKTAYKKIWLLLNLGCVFVGHGLLKDFRTINIHVPKSQVIDTVELFYLKSRGRKLSLRFLSWLLLGEEVQIGMHDSIEDARTALRLYKRYQEYEEEGNVETVLNEIYKRGFRTGFKVPTQGDSPSKDSLQDLGHDGITTRRDPDSLPVTPKGRSAGLVAVKGAYDDKG